jgi:hypothetical protein
MTNPNIGKKINIASIKKTSDKIKAQAEQSAKKAVLPSGQKTPKPPAERTVYAPQTGTTRTRTQSDIDRRLKNVKLKGVYFDLNVYDELQRVHGERGQSISHYVNGLVKKDLGI